MLRAGLAVVVLVLAPSLARADSYAGGAARIELETSTPTMPVNVDNNTSDTVSAVLAGEYGRLLTGPLWLHAQGGIGTIHTPSLNLFPGPEANGREVEAAVGIEVRGCLGTAYVVCGFLGEDVRVRAVAWSSENAPDDGRMDVGGVTRFGFDLMRREPVGVAPRVEMDALQNFGGTDGTHLGAGVALTLGLVYAWR